MPKNSGISNGYISKAGHSKTITADIMDMKPLKEVSSHEACPPSSKAKGHSGLRVCLAGSGGGHVRQLLDLETVWSEYEYFIVSEVSRFFAQPLQFASRLLCQPFRLWAGKTWLAVPHANGWPAQFF